MSAYTRAWLYETLPSGDKKIEEQELYLFHRLIPSTLKSYKSLPHSFNDIHCDLFFPKPLIEKHDKYTLGQER